MNTSKHGYSRAKLASCLRLAKACSRDSWQREPLYKREFLWVKKGALADARYWRAQI